MDLLQLKYFCHAAQTENFSKTAAAFFVPATGVSQAIKRLEKELCTRLFNREANKIALSDTGRAFYAKVAYALDLIDEAKAGVDAANTRNAGRIKLLVHTCRRIATQTVEAFKNDFPDVSFVIHHTKDAACGDYDIIVSDRAFSSKLTQKTLLLSEKIALACHSKNPLAKKADIQADDLKGQDFIAMSAGNSLHEVLTSVSAATGFTPRIAIQSDDPFYVRKYLDENLGIALVPEISWRGTFSKNVRLKPFGNFTRDTYVFFDDAQFMPHIQRQFLAYLKKAFEKESAP